MATAIDTEKGSEEYKDAKCSICAQENKDENADHYCFDCNKHLCASCLGTHNKFNENHNVVQGLGDGKDVLTEKCGKHADELITLYCRQHDELLCRKCRLLDHRDCQVRRPVENLGDRPVVKPEKKPSKKNPPGSKQVRNINVRIPGDKSMHLIYGCCHLSDGSLVISDNRNKRLKRVDPSNSKVTKYCDTDDLALDVCCIGPQEVAVTFPCSTQVHVYNTESLTRTRTVELGHLTSIIACHGGRLYCNGWDDGDILYIHDVSSGRELRKISKDTVGRELFSGMSVIHHIAVNGSGDRVYVTDTWSGLVCVSTHGRPIFYLSPPDLGLDGITGVTLDHHGHVFVCGSDSHNVVKVTEDGHVVGQILSKEDGVKSPACLSYDVNRSSLYVGGVSDQLVVVEWK